MNPGDRCERQLGHDFPLEDAVEHAKEGGEGETDGKHALHLDHHEVAVRVLEPLLVPLHLPLLGPVQGCVAVSLLLLLQTLRLLLNVQLQLLVFLRPVDQEPSETLAQQRREDGDPCKKKENKKRLNCFQNCHYVYRMKAMKPQVVILILD